MKNGRIVIVVGRSPALDVALDAMAELDLPVRVIPTVPEAERALLAADTPRVSAVLLSLEEDPAGALALLSTLRARPGFAPIPIAVWAPAGGGDLLADAYQAGATSGVLLDGSDEDPIRLARMVHYWAAANEPPLHEIPA